MRYLFAAGIVWSLVAPSASGELILHWRLDETSGNTAADSTGSGLDGVWQGTTGTPNWQPAAGISGGAFQFTGATADSFIVPVTAVTGTPFTMSGWVKTTSTENDGVIYLGNGATGDRYYVLRVGSGNARLGARNTSEQTAVGPLVNNNQWHHIAGIFDGPTLRQLYVDGAPVATNTTNVPSLTPTRFGIGALTRNTPYSPADLYTGLMDDVQLYSGALSPNDIAFLYNNPGSAIPEPSTAVMLLGLAAAGLIGYGRNRRRK